MSKIRRHAQVYVTRCNDGSFDVVENLNGKDIGNYHYYDLDSIYNDFSNCFILIYPEDFENEI